MDQIKKLEALDCKANDNNGENYSYWVEEVKMSDFEAQYEELKKERDEELKMWEKEEEYERRYWFDE